MTKESKSKSKAASADDIMATGELRPILKLAKGGKPVSCAVCVSADGEGVILAHKQMAPKKLRGELTKAAEKLDLKLDEKTLRFGRASVSDTDETLLRLTVNREPSGASLYAAIKRRIKPAGFSDIEITADANIENEPDENEAATGQASTDTSAPPPPMQAGAPAPDIGALQGALRKLIPGIPAASGGDHERLESLKKLAVLANVNIKTNNAAAAATMIAELEKLIESAPPPSGEAAAGEGSAVGSNPTGQAPPALEKGVFVAMQKSRLAWDGARKRVASEIKSLKDAVGVEFDGDPEEFEATDALDQLDDILAKLDERLLDTLDEMLAEKDPGKHAGLRDEAKELIDEYVQYVQGNSLLGGLDGDTPFGMKLSIASTMTGTLKVLQQTLR